MDLECPGRSDRGESGSASGHVESLVFGPQCERAGFELCAHAWDIGRIRAAEAEGLGWPEGEVVDPAIRRMGGALHSSEPGLRVRLRQGERPEQGARSR